MTTLNFIHIPKTAGTNLKEYFHQALPNYEVCFVYWPQTLGFRHQCQQPICLPPEVCARAQPAFAKQFRVFFGHVGFNRFPQNPDAVFAAFVRAPLARTQSWFGHILRNGYGNERLLKAVQKDTGYGEIIERFQVTQLDNGQVRMLAGVSKPYGQITEADFQKACKNIEERFSFLGITERFNRSVDLLFHNLDLPRHKMPDSMNRGDSRQGMDTTLSADAPYAYWDVRLYEFAQEHFERALRDANPGSVWEVDGESKA